MPYSMNIVDYSIFFLGNVDVDLLVFLENFLGNEGVDMVSHVMVFLHFAHPCHPSSFQGQCHPLSFVLGL
jgi:hypothetical protein